MMRKLLKSGLSVLLALILIILPSQAAASASFAASFAPGTSAYSAASLTPGISAAYTASLTSGASAAFAAADYTAARQLAKLKAAVLTNTAYGAVSVQYALIDNGEIVISGQAGSYSKDKTVALTKDHMYGIGSVSKVFTAAAVMQLAERGKLALDKPVVGYLPAFKMADSRYRDITVRMLLNHSSGLMGSSFHNSAFFGGISADYDLLASLKTQRLKADPGEFSVYCNDGFSLAELLVEKVSGMGFSEYIRKNISDPLELNNTMTPLEDFPEDKLVKAYRPGSKSPLPAEALAVIGAGGIYSTAEDLCEFSRIFMEDAASGILSAKSVQAMEAPEYRNGFWPEEGDSAISYGLGWDSVNLFPFTEYDIPALSKGGDTALYHCSLVVLPGENMAMAVLSSGGASTFNQLMAQEVLLSVLKAKGSIDEILPAKKAVKPAASSMPSMPAAMKKWEGIYSFSGGVVRIAIGDTGILTLKTILPAASTQRFTYAGDNKFYSGDGSVYITFAEESNGNTYLKAEGYVTYTGLGQLAQSDYQAQRITDNPISKSLQEIWRKRDNKKYFLIDEAYNSQFYSLSQAYLRTDLLEELEGYFMNAAILDENTARTLVEIPGMYGRDLSDYEFYYADGKEYLKTSGFLMISEDAVGELSEKAKFTCAIGSDGYAQWFKISGKSARKKIQVTLPEASSFSVYDYSGNCVYSSTISALTTVTLPAYGYIVFAGSPGAKFTVKYTE
jgi:CubicO group peptidase (beta-lactamase class C family)